MTETGLAKQDLTWLPTGWMPVDVTVYAEYPPYRADRWLKVEVRHVESGATASIRTYRPFTPAETGWLRRSLEVVGSSPVPSRVDLTVEVRPEALTRWW